jgi:hypothetical protein
LRAARASTAGRPAETLRVGGDELIANGADGANLGTTPGLLGRGYLYSFTKASRASSSASGVAPRRASVALQPQRGYDTGEVGADGARPARACPVGD